jgi:hypothetical protein
MFELFRINSKQWLRQKYTELHFMESALPENSDLISFRGAKTVVVRGKKPNFDPKTAKTRNDISISNIDPKPQKPE